MEERLSNIFKITKVMEWSKVILKISYRLLQVTLKWKALKKPVYFLNSFEFRYTFYIKSGITVAIFWEKL